MSTPSPKNILVIRNDKLGDFMLAWPALSLLKQQYPETKITVLVPPYTEPVAKLCPWIDNVILDKQHKSLLSDAFSLAKIFKQHHFDASISLFTETRTAMATFLSRIPVRVSPATKLAQIFSNNRLRQKRSESAKPEYEYNTDLIRYFIERQGDTAEPLIKPPYLNFKNSEIQKIREQYTKDNKITDDAKLVIIHPGSGGSAINFSVEQYAELIKTISKQDDIHFIITAGPGEDKIAETLSALIANTSHSVFISTLGLVAFSQFIAIANLFIGGSTGPLHIAGALDIPTAAFYPARQSATKLRWQTLNKENRRIAFSPEKYIDENDMKTIDPKACGLEISGFIKKLAS